MKKLAVVFALLVSVCAFGAIDDTMIIVGTQGPDKYADGTVVLDGERYALVWSQTQFAGFQANGSLVNPDDQVLIVVSRAKNGACRKFAYPVKSSVVAKGGEISLWLLDTRVYGADNAVSFAKAESATKVEAITAAAKVEATIDVQNPCSAPIDSEGTVQAKSDAVAIPADAPQPKISAITTDDNFVYVDVENTVPYLRYDVAAGDKPAELKSGAATSNPSGNASEKITIITPKTGATGFFAVTPK